MDYRAEIPICGKARRQTHSLDMPMIFWSASRDDAERFYRQLSKRLEQFGLRIATEKTRIIEFGRFARTNAKKRGKKPEEFDFLGFTHYCGKPRTGTLQEKATNQQEEVPTRKISSSGPRTGATC